MREMKDSGIEWIGELPIGWETRKIKYVATLNGRIGWQGLTSSEYCDDGAYLITGINFDNGQIDWSTCVHVPMERWAEAPQIQIQNGDLLITKDGTVGKVAIVSNMPSETSLNSGVLLIRTVASRYKKYLFWILQSEIFWKWFNTINAGNSTIIHLYQYDFCNFSFPFPKYSLQCNIANYLDRKCSQIDAIIARQQEVIEKLKAYKLSVITEAVTKGLKPDVPMKDSGVEWIGEIPEHWILNKLKYLSLDIGDGIHATPTYDVDGNIYFVNGNNIGEEYLVFKEDTNAISDTEYASYKLPLLTENTVFITLNGATYGKTSFYHGEKVLLGKSAGFITLKSTESREFIRYYLQSYTAKLIMDLSLLGSTIANLSLRTLRDFVIPYPPKEEQIQIVNHLNNRTSGIDAAISKKKKIVDELIDYKKSLIYEVVTGKKEV